MGKRHYLVTLDSGRTVKRHINQLLTTLVKKKSVLCGPSQSFNIPRPSNPNPGSIISVHPQDNPAQEIPANSSALISHKPPVQQEVRRSTRERHPPVRFGDSVLS